MIILPRFTMMRGLTFVTASGVGMVLSMTDSNGVLRLPSDPIGSTTVTFDGVNANSEIRVYLPDGTEAAGIENCAANQVLTWPVYAAGSPNNTVTIRIINWLYDIKELTYTASVGSASLPIQQKRDKWSLNPA